MPYRDIITQQLNRLAQPFPGNSTGNTPSMLMLGGFKFALNTAVFQQMQRRTAWNWPAQQRTGQLDALQFTGPGMDRITLPGIIYPEFFGGTQQLESLRQLGTAGQPLRMIAATGDMLGMWVVESIEETASEFTVAGTPRKQEFTITLRKYSDADL